MKRLIPAIGLAMFMAAAFVADPAVAADKKPNIVIIWGDDIGQTQHQRLLEGPDGLPDAQHRSGRQGRHALHRLLRRAELHGRARGVHHRAERLPHRPEQGRAAGRRPRHAGRKTRPSPSC